MPRDRIIDIGRCGRSLVAESSVQERPAGSSVQERPAGSFSLAIFNLLLLGYC